MGLDVFLARCKKDEDINSGEHDWIDVVCDWRNCYQIHRWFNENVGGKYGNHYNHILRVHKIDLESLLKVIDQVLNDNSKAAALLPAIERVFEFPDESFDYDEDYFDELKETRSMLEKVIDEFDFENEKLHYYAW